MKTISGFSKLSKKEKINWLASQLNSVDQAEFLSIDRFWHSNEQEQKTFDDFSENTISNFFFPFGVAPNFIINEKVYTIPLVIEESSVVAAASKSAKFWSSKGGFKAEVLSTVKKGQVHFSWNGDSKKLQRFFDKNKNQILDSVSSLVSNMKKRGGGILNIKLVNMTDSLENYYQIDVEFETCDAMGANFINSVLEKLGDSLTELALVHNDFSDSEKELEVIMCILSNYTPECIVEASVECKISELGKFADGMLPEDFANKFKRAIDIANVDISRAVTHNKGIFNGVDAVILATGNDFRSIEACGHAYASKDGHYRSLSKCTLEGDVFKFSLKLPLALGTVGGLTNLHPMAQISLKLLDNPSAKELMGIVASVGLAQNFGAVTSLVTTGIQKGHMKMHLLNICNQLNASDYEIAHAKEYFKSNTVSFASVRELFEILRESK